MAEVPASAVAILKSLDTGMFLVEGRPPRGGERQLAYAGSSQLFGGGIEPRETALQAIGRELREELGLWSVRPKFLWKGTYNHSQNKAGETVARPVHLFYVPIPTAVGLEMLVDGNIVYVSPQQEALATVQPPLTRFALWALTTALTIGVNKPWHSVSPN